ncbi:hypothetical protein HWC97_gp37 [Flavobacterium phage vB_FspS_snusmum6-1]|uniref:Uncharacterized protein n=3 Tax=Muminvirus snusmum TaxID=2844298 RepID=A0A6B9LG15_9CAUD|nr:hypothetical protein HWC97_gp37 [Flavobacterium phage vB_FspS_snusmum6-1]QHB40611.1 hypothetical protein snusmum61_gp037 [Flavobacterium phage vB_FspS_snusmum6-1]QHB40683.1 hypothetical protein snusmum62_gp037 [Flavobacterium phage vB_FspS_snusmum6-2]QHB40756.1 hypothetical protein snusmum63_gp037 [Flavobacterium phage vB_FspS_snusmum6-3]QHB40827.1 hypothetical protein snusmum91_gp036 [Flavobacterium phage vB_FspS_snusmum9-1]
MILYNLSYLTMYRLIVNLISFLIKKRYLCLTKIYNYGSVKRVFPKAIRRNLQPIRKR